MSLKSPVYTYLHAGTGLCTSSNGGHYGAFFKPEKNLVFFFRLKKCPIDAAPGRLE